MMTSMDQVLIATARQGTAQADADTDSLDVKMPTLDQGGRCSIQEATTYIENLLKGYPKPEDMHDYVAKVSW